MLKSLRFALPMLLLVGVMSTFAQEGPPPMPEIDGDIIVEGLNGPQALHVDSAGNLWITENGLGGDEEIEFFNVNTYEPEPGMIGNTSRVLRVSPDGEQTVVAELPSLAVMVSELPLFTEPVVVASSNIMVTLFMPLEGTTLLEP